MILMIGASGAVGKPALRALVAQGAAVRALSSNADSAKALEQAGAAETVVGDLRNADDLARAMAGADQVFFVMPRFQEDETAASARVIDAAKAGGVGHFLYCSVYHPQLTGLLHHAQKLAVEEHLIESGMAFTILRPAMFMQNLNMEWAQVSGDGIYPRPYSPDQEMAVIDTGDLAEVIATVLTDPARQGGCYDLVGDRLTHAEMAGHVGEALGRDVRAEPRSLDDWRAAAEKRGASAYFIDAYSRMCAHYDAHGFPGGNPLVLQALLGRAPTTYPDFAKAFVAAKAAG